MWFLFAFALLEFAVVAVGMKNTVPLVKKQAAKEKDEDADKQNMSGVEVA